MAGNPLEADPAREARIRDRAYHLWIDEGRPHGRHAEFWERARELVGMEESAGAGQLPNPQRAGHDPAAEEPIEEAFLQENLGEFPGRFADQGETEQTPHAKRRTQSEAASKVAPVKAAPDKAGPGKAPKDRKPETGQKPKSEAKKGSPPKKGKPKP